MKAIVKVKEGRGNVKLCEVARPVIKDDEILIKVKAAGICGTDIHILNDNSYPIDPPVTIGHEVAGVVEKVGKNAAKFKKNDRVVTETYYITCGTCEYCRSGRNNLCADRKSIGSGVNGGMAEYVAVPEKLVHILPDNVPYEQGALIEPLTCCIQAVYEKVSLKPDDCVLITGPGSIGLLCMQAIKTFGSKVIIVGTRKDEERLKIAKKLGADVILYSESDGIKEQIIKETRGLGPHYTFDCSGAVSGILLCIESVRKGGTHVQIGLSNKPTPIDFSQIALREITIIGTFAQKSIWWDTSIRLVENGKINLKVIASNTHPIEEWEKGFKQVMAGEGLKHVILPKR
ncbi:zinc-dependent alcohol dehydrogenase [Clostridium sp. LBM24168]